MDSADRSAADGALEVFANWLARREQGERIEFEALLGQHAGLRAELVELHATWERLSAASEPQRSSLQERLQSRFGAASLTEVSLRERADGGTAGDLSSALIAQLSAHDKHFGRYQIRGEVARGGMGAILKIWDEELRRHLAMKVILGQADARPSGTTPPVESSKIARFLEEAQVTGQLDHPGIVPVHELGLDPEGRLYFTMKLVKGESLHAIFEHVRDGKDDWSQTRALNVLLKVCEAMAYAHDKGVIHRDLKPANVMVGKFGEVHVMDWGLARIEGQKDRKDIRIREEHPRTTQMQGVRSGKREESPDSPLCTMDGDVVGTPAYMPPEQAAGKVEEVGPHSDVYALGAMLYHLVAGHPPYIPRGVRLNNYAVWARVQEGPPKSIEELVPDVPPELAAICNRAMARDWKQRYRDMSELAEDLSAYLNQRVVRAYETGTWAETRKWVQRNRSLAASLATALLLLAAGLTVSLLFKARADEKERLATQKANDVLSLSAIQNLKNLEARALKLWPAGPESLSGYEAWLAEARLLVEGRPSDPATGAKPRTSLAEHKAKLAELRLRARPLSPEQVEAERRNSPQRAAWQQARAQLGWMRRMLGEEPWASEAEVASALGRESLPGDAKELNGLACELVGLDPPNVVYGSEVRGLVLARLALAAASNSQRPWFRDTLAWALYRCGQFDLAITEKQRALGEVQGALKDRVSEQLSRLQESVASWKSDSGRVQRVEESARLGARVAELERSVNERRTYEFEDSEDSWWHTQLSQLVDDLTSFTSEEQGGSFTSGVSRDRGWGVVKRAAFARTIEERSVTGTEARIRWDEACAAIAVSSKYAGLRLKPQVGLLPIGADPQSGLWEFAHLQTGEPAQRGSDGKLVLTESTGLVFVLIPGGSFWMGAQATDPYGRNFDAQAIESEGPVHEVVLSPFFLSKYEMTQGQWESCTGFNPSSWGPGTGMGTLGDPRLHPVESVSWTDCKQVMFRLGLSLPSEAQWECGCRGGGETAWWTGAERQGLRGRVNLADRTAARAGANWSSLQDWPDLDDGWPLHAPVGTFAANPFGLHDVHGNVFELCLDTLTGYSSIKQVDPVSLEGKSPNRVIRGGAFDSTAGQARSAFRYTTTLEMRLYDLGLRPARALE